MSATHLSLNSTPRTILGNTGMKLRKLGIIPAVVYGYNIKESINITLNYNEFVKVFRSSGNTAVVDLEVDGKKIHTLVHAIQYHPVKDTYIHIDFLAVNLKQVVEAEVPLVFIGTPLPVKQDGAILQRSIESISVSALPDSIPHEIEVDLGAIDTINTTIQVKDLKTINGVTFLNEPDELIASVGYAKEDEEESVTPETIVGQPVVAESSEK